MSGDGRADGAVRIRRNAHPTRGRRAVSRPPVPASHQRLALGRFVLVAALVAAGLKLGMIQFVWADELSAQAAAQRSTVEILHAQRGKITDRNGTPLAITIEARSLYAMPQRITAEQREAGNDPQLYKRKMAHTVEKILGAEVSEAEVLTKLMSDETVVQLAEAVEPADARAIREQYPEISAEYRAVRVYPGGNLASSILGAANWRANQQRIRGMVGLEAYADTLLAGIDGKRVVDTAQGSHTVIPGSQRKLRPAVPGTGLQLTIDADLQYVVQQKLSEFARKTGAEGGSVVVLDAQTAEVRAMANMYTFNPNNLAAADPDHLGNPAVSAPVEPGSVNKVITFAAALEYGVIEPDTVLRVPGRLPMGSTVITDAWEHGTVRMTATGVLAESSNIGTLLIAQRVGKKRFLDMLYAFGLGQPTGIALPAESGGEVPPMSEWSGSTFANLPIGQGLSMTVLQMASVYQTIANNGVRIPPRIIDAEIAPDGTLIERPVPEGVRVISAQTARTLRNMLQAVVQDKPGADGTAPEADLPGYEIAAKTGTAQQVDPDCGCYSNSHYWINFAGILPADHPQLVIAISLDDPSVHSAAPLFHDIAAYIAERYNVPTSPHPEPVTTLTLS